MQVGWVAIATEAVVLVEFLSGAGVGATLSGSDYSPNPPNLCDDSQRSHFPYAQKLHL
ncbi:hypothetical protein [uncultured Helicobacter sp.]|uniref:hypothetical protein n=1 Tax=uncultured Helicobacter sp. TaxID=175537 RepID=UPI00375265EB